MAQKTPLLINFISYNALWFACILSGSTGYQWASVLVLAVLLALHFRFVSKNAPRDWALIAAAAGFGLLTDSLLAGFGIMSFHSGWPVVPAWVNPIWMLTLWAGFSTTLYVIFGWMQGRVWLMALMGATGGPGAYYAGALLGALELHGSLWISMSLIALQYGVALPVLYWVGDRFPDAANIGEA
ncbi:MAG: DUF2878 domain-containing protein [Sumerlaeia bacterium]